MHNLPRNTQPFLLLGSTSEGNKAVTLTGADFERHKWIMGISGSGKSTFLAWVAVSLLRQGIAFSLIDPHGDLARLILSLLSASDFYTNEKAYQTLWFIDFARSDAVIPFNVLKQPFDSHTIANNLLEAIHRAFPTTGTTANLDNVLLASFYVLAECGRPLTDLQRLLLDSSFRHSLLTQVHDPLVVQFFNTKLAEKGSSQLIDSTMRRAFLLTFSPRLRAALAHTENTLNFRSIMDNQISCLFSLGGLDDISKRLLGCLLLVELEQAFLSRAALSPDRRFPYHMIVDEFPLFSASGDSFSVILEQVRKFKGTLYLAHQTYSQLTKGMTGSLQNAIPIMMKAGTDDSNALVSRFYRPTEERPDLFSVLLGKRSTPSPFTDVKNAQEARFLFENLKRQEAIITLNGTAQKIITPTLPIGKADHTQLTALERAYAQRLLTPLSLENASLPTTVESVPAPLAVAKRRVLRSSAPLPPFQTFVGASGTQEQLQAIFAQYHYLTVAQVAKLLGKSENTARNKLKKLKALGILETQHVPRTSPSGKTPVVFSLKKGVRKHEFLEHALATSELLINTALLPSVVPDCTILDLQSDLTLRSSPIKLADGNLLVPDGYVRLCSSTYEYALYFECDRNTEFQKEKIVAKLNNYMALAIQRTCMVVAFCVVEGGDLRVKTLRKWAADIVPVPFREVFLFAALDLTTSLTPETLFLTSSWLPIGEGPPLTLIER